MLLLLTTNMASVTSRAKPSYIDFLCSSLLPHTNALKPRFHGLSDSSHDVLNLYILITLHSTIAFK